MKLRGGARLGMAAASAILVATACHSAPDVIGPKAARIHGPIHTEGSSIIDSKGHVVLFNGVNVRNFVSSATAGTSCQGSRPQEVAANVAAWGFNSVRIPLAWSNIEPQPPVVGSDGTIIHEWNQTYLSSLDAFIGDVSRRGLAVILVMHAKYAVKARGRCDGAPQPDWVDPPPSTDLAAAGQARCDFLRGTTVTGPAGDTWDEYTALWTMLAQRYASYPQVVAIDMLNEPYATPPCTASEVRIGDLYQKIAGAVRDVDPSIALVVEDSPPALALRGIFEVDPPLNLSNTIYSYHLYQPDWVPQGKAVNEAYADRAKEWGDPLLVGEFNGFGYQAPGRGFDPNWAEDTAAAMATWKRDGVSWMVSAYDGGNHLVDRDGAPRADLISTYQKGFDTRSS